MAVYEVSVPYDGIAHIVVEADSEVQAIVNARAGDYLSSDDIPYYAQVLWGDAYVEKR